MLKRFYVFILFALLTGCGFHLQGLQNLPPDVKNLYVDAASPNSTLIQNINQHLLAQKVTLTNSPQAASAILKILNIQQQQSQISITGGAQAAQYLLTYSVTFSVITPKGKVLLATTTVQSSRTYNSNATQVLSANSQVAQLNMQMEQELAQDIINQLANL